MRCRKCRAKWSLEDNLGPGGNASPGQYSCVAIGLLILGSPALYFGETGALVFAFTVPIAAIVFLMALCGCGYKRQGTAYQGSKCPECGHQNWIWPWNF